MAETTDWERGEVLTGSEGEAQEVPPYHTQHTWQIQQQREAEAKAQEKPAEE